MGLFSAEIGSAAPAVAHDLCNGIRRAKHAGTVAMLDRPAVPGERPADQLVCAKLSIGMRSKGPPDGALHATEPDRCFNAGRTRPLPGGDTGLIHDQSPLVSRKA